jgi:hypothetical protein
MAIVLEGFVESAVSDTGADEKTPLRTFSASNRTFAAARGAQPSGYSRRRSPERPGGVPGAAVCSLRSRGDRLLARAVFFFWCCS